MRTPVLVVGGFLGSGKTTLVRSLLADAQREGIRMAVISNEFGELGIDAALLGAGASRMVELAGGCVCCELSDDLVDTLTELHETVAPDRIVIECSGVALPFDTQLHLYRPPVRDWLGDDACVVVADAERWDETDPLYEEQLASADLVVLSKGDLVDADTLALARERIQAVTVDAPIVEVIHGDVPIELLFPSGPRPDRGPGADRSALTPHPDHDHDHDHDHGHDPHRPHHHADWTSFELHIAPGQAEAEVEAALLSECAARIKGFVLTTEGVRLVQGVGRRIEFTEPDGEVEGTLVGRVVVIRRTRPLSA